MAVKTETPPALPAPFPNPFRPGAGHMPPYLAGRTVEEDEFKKLLEQTVILKNLILTGLRGVGKTVLLESFRPIASKTGWLWVGTDLSESTSVSEQTIALRIIADLASATSQFTVAEESRLPAGFGTVESTTQRFLNYHTLAEIYEATPGLIADKLKFIFDLAWSCVKGSSHKGLVFAYDEAQTLDDNASREQYPFSLLLDVFQSIQRKNIPFMLILTGLPPLITKLSETRTYTERMFHTLFLRELSWEASKLAIREPVNKAGCPVNFSDTAVDLICDQSGGYPYFIQFICREAFDEYLNDPNPATRNQLKMSGIVAKLDADFFHGRWQRATDRQRELLEIISRLSSARGEFAVREIVAQSSKGTGRPFGASQVNQMLDSLTKMGLIFKPRHGKYSFAVPLLHEFIQRQVPYFDLSDIIEESEEEVEDEDIEEYNDEVEPEESDPEVEEYWDEDEL